MLRDGRALLVVLLVLASSCVTMDPPAGYVRLRNPGPYEMKAVSARGQVIALSSRANEDSKADLKFWSDAVEYQKATLDGLKPIGRETVRSERGLDGTLLTFESGEGQGKMTYLVALFVTPSRIHTIEAAGPAVDLKTDMEKLRKSILSLR